MRGAWASRLLCAALMAGVCGRAEAGAFAVRTAGAATVIAVDRDSIRANGLYRTGWTYEMFRERNPLAGPRTQITGVLTLVYCKTLLVRRLRVVHYLANGTTLSAIGPERVWTDSLRGSNTDLMLQAMCRGPGSEWAERKAGSVFDLYRLVWR